MTNDFFMCVQNLWAKKENKLSMKNPLADYMGNLYKDFVVVVCYL